MMPLTEKSRTGSTSRMIHELEVASSLHQSCSLKSRKPTRSGIVVVMLQVIGVPVFSGASNLNGSESSEGRSIHCVSVDGDDTK